MQHLASNTGFRPELLPSDGSLGRIRTYRRGAVLWSRASPISSVFVVRRGEVEVTVPGFSTGTVVRRVRTGEVCGLFSFCEARQQTPHSTGRASVRCEVLEIPHADFVAFLTRRADVLLAVLVSACERLAYAEDRIHVLSCRGAEDRLLTLLLQLANRNGHHSRTDANVMVLHYTHAELARSAAMTRSHVSTVLARLRESRVVQYGRGTALHLDVRAALARLRNKETVVAA
ncbi:MAG TPA: Crp/Fnr family transcriptional regulator [Bryobacteraceae bacterium]|nr:Crp/Fnr family transcriptional regulator [Bryobacteraceae bacterium]